MAGLARAIGMKVRAWTFRPSPERAAQLGVDRAAARVAVLGAIYGQTTGNGARALRGCGVSLGSTGVTSPTTLTLRPRSGAIGSLRRPGVAGLASKNSLISTAIGYPLGLGSS